MDPDLLDPHRKESCPMRSDIALTAQAVTNIQTSLDKIEVKLEKLAEALEAKFVTKEEFKIVQRLVYGTAGVILFSALISLLALILPHVKA